MRVYRDTDGDGVVDAGEPWVGASQTGTTDFEQTTLAPPGPEPGKYIVRMNNFAASEPYNGSVTFKSKPRFQAAQVESWTLTCETSAGAVLSTHQVTINRGQRPTVAAAVPRRALARQRAVPRLAARCRAPIAARRCRASRAAPEGLADRAAVVGPHTRPRLRAKRRRGRSASLCRRVPGGARRLPLPPGQRAAVEAAACRRPIIIRARGTTRWSFNRRVRLARGRYAALGGRRCRRAATRSAADCAAGRSRSG